MKVPWSYPFKGVRPESIKASEAICREVIKRSGCNQCSMAFSGGKDSVVTLALLSQFFERVVPIYWYLIPNLSFVEEALTYYETVFGVSINRLPHSDRFNVLFSNWIFQPPYRITALDTIMAETPFNFTMDDLVGEVRQLTGLDTLGSTGTGALHATGIRASDSPTRAGIFRKHGGFGTNGLLFYPIITWNLNDVEAVLIHTGLKLSVEYQWIGRSFDGIKRRYLECVREHYPADYQRIKDDFPLVDLEWFRAKINNVEGRIPLFKYQNVGQTPAPPKSKTQRRSR